jgi:predicted lipoprotein with Yx(FWY)xxD motif
VTSPTPANPNSDPSVDLRNEIVGTRTRRLGMRSGRIQVFAVAVVFPLMLGACSEDVDTGGGGTPSSAESPEPSEDMGDATVAVEDSELGQIVVDAEGRTLYRFLADTGNDSTCYEDCEDSWPALTVEGDPVAGDGIDGSLLGTTERDDGSLQVTLDGHPLYHFSGDEAPGDTNGQEIGDVWYVVSADGEPIEG